MIISGIITFCVLLVIAVLVLVFGLTFGIFGFLGKLVFGIIGLGFKLTFKTLLFAAGVVALLFLIF